MLRNLRKLSLKNISPIYLQKQTFLTNDYKCLEAWSSQTSSPILEKVNLNDFYNIIDQNFSSKGVISAIDVDIFANAMKDSVYLEELKDLLHKLRLSAETVNTLASTHHATIRNYIELGYIEELVNILQEPLNYGLFLDDFTANILLDKLILSEDYALAAKVASLIMLQEDFSNDITCALCLYVCYKYISGAHQTVTEPPAAPEKGKKVEEIKIRIKFLRNPYFDDHFDIKDITLLSGKTLAWISENANDNLHSNLQILGWLKYKKYEKLQVICENLCKSPASKAYSEVIEHLKTECNNVQPEVKEKLEKCISLLEKLSPMEVPLEESLKILIENAINKVQSNDILQQKQLFKSWAEIRQQKLEEQTKRLDRAKRMELIQEKQKELGEQEQKLWFFENEDAIDLQIEKKEKLVGQTVSKKNDTKVDENYIPPEILPKRK